MNSMTTQAQREGLSHAYFPSNAFRVSIERGTSHRVYNRRPWLSEISKLGRAPYRFLARPVS